jgi:hypothetical protein
MNKRIVGGALFAVSMVVPLLSARSALAEESWGKIYDQSGPGTVGKQEVARVEKSCNFRMMSRMGPDPREVAACDGAIKQLQARGAAAVPAILAALDREEVGYGARSRLYTALARVGDATVADRVVDGMAKIASGKMQGRLYEVDSMEEVVREITKAEPEGRAPWVPEPVVDPYRKLTDDVVSWRLVAKANAGKTPQQVESERLADARAHVNDPDVEKAYKAIRYLKDHEPDEALKAADDLLTRLPKSEASGPTKDRKDPRPHLESLRRQAEWEKTRRINEAAEKAKKAPQKKGPPPQQQAPKKPTPDSKARS